MKRFKEIKDLLENVYFINEEAQLVVTFLENIGFSKPEKLVHDELGTLCGDREVMPAVDFFQECTGRKIDDRYSLSTVLVMAIDDYVSQLKELKEEQYRSNEQARKDQDIVRSHDIQGNLDVVCVFGFNLRGFTWGRIRRSQEKGRGSGVECLGGYELYCSIIVLWEGASYCILFFI